MKLTLTKEEIQEVLNKYIVTISGKSIEYSTAKFKVWGEEYDPIDAEVEYTVEAVTNPQNL